MMSRIHHFDDVADINPPGIVLGDEDFVLVRLFVQHTFDFVRL